MDIKELRLLWDCVRGHSVCNLKDESVHFHNDMTAIHRDGSLKTSTLSPHINKLFIFK